MPATSPHPSPQFATLVHVYKALYRALMAEPALKERLFMFLPYYVYYRGHSSYSVMLIHPEKTLNIQFPSEGAARKFLETNEQLIETAVREGRDPRSIIHKRVAQVVQGEPEVGAYIDPSINGNIQYRYLKQIAKKEAEEINVEIPDGVEYNVDDSCPHVYPVAGIVRQKSVDGQHGKIIAIVSMDFEDKLSEKVEAVFNSVMEPFDFENMYVWDFPPGKTVVEYFNDVRLADTPYQAVGKDGVVWHDAPKGPRFDFSDRLAPVEKVLAPADYKRLRDYLDRIDKYASDLNIAAERKHLLLRALHDPQIIEPLFLWLAADGSLKKAPEISEIKIKEAVKATRHFKLKRTVEQGRAKELIISLIELVCEWEPNLIEIVASETGICCYIEFLSERRCEDLYERIMGVKASGYNRFTGRLWNLARAAHQAASLRKLKNIVQPHLFEEPIDFRAHLGILRSTAAVSACFFPHSEGSALGVVVRGDIVEDK